MTSRRAISLLVLLYLSLPLLAQTVSLAGTVKAGETCSQPIGHGLTLLVTTTSIEVRGVGEKNFAACVTPPYHGPNPLDIEPWEFVDKDNHPLPDSQLQEELTRDFSFALSAADDEKACKELNVVLYTPPRTLQDGTVEYGNPGYREPPMGKGTVTLSHVTLDHLGKGETPQVSSFQFSARIDLPALGSGNKRAK